MIQGKEQVALTGPRAVLWYFYLRNLVVTFLMLVCPELILID